MRQRNNPRIASLVILIAAYALHERGLFVAYHLFRAFSLLAAGHR
jgi:hypothetical protein